MKTVGISDPKNLSTFLFTSCLTLLISNVGTANFMDPIVLGVILQFGEPNAHGQSHLLEDVLPSGIIFCVVWFCKPPTPKKQKEKEKNEGIKKGKAISKALTDRNPVHVNI